MPFNLDRWKLVALLLTTAGSLHLLPAAEKPDAIPSPEGETSRLVWDKQRERVDANINGWPLPRLLENIAAATGWQIFLEPDTKHLVSTKFKEKPAGEALRLLLGNLSFALVPQHQAAPKLFVFRTSMQQATELIEPKAKPESEPSAKPIPNQLVVRVKPGTNIDELAKQLGAKVIGRAEGLNAYLLEFPDEESTNRARETLKSNQDVASIENNYPISRPVPLDSLTLSSSQPIRLQPKAVGASDRVIVGLIDTAIQRGSGAVDPFLLPTIAIVDGANVPQNTPTHATAMAETILRGVTMVNGGQDSAVRILPVDVYGNKTTSSTFDVAYGIYKAINAGAMIVNLSLGSDGNTQMLYDVIKSGHDQGVIFFAAAGNEPVTTPTYPAAYPESVAVTATDGKNHIAPYANRGDFVDTAAPGMSLVNFADKSFLVMGTSPATALTSGTAAGHVDRTGATYPATEAAVRKNLAIRPQIAVGK